MNEPTSETDSDKVWVLDAVCIHCNKRIHAVCIFIPQEEPFRKCDKYW